MWFHRQSPNGHLKLALCLAAAVVVGRVPWRDECERLRMQEYAVQQHTIQEYANIHVIIFSKSKLYNIWQKSSGTHKKPIVIRNDAVVMPACPCAKNRGSQARTPCSGYQRGLRRQKDTLQDPVSMTFLNTTFDARGILIGWSRPVS